MTTPTREWWARVEGDRWTTEVEQRALNANGVNVTVARDPGEAVISVTLRWFAEDLDDAVRRICDATGLDPTAFRAGYPLAL